LEICELTSVCSFSVHLVNVAVSSVQSVLILVLIVWVISFSMSFMIVSRSCFASSVGVGVTGVGGDTFALVDTIPSLFFLFGLLLFNAGYSFGSNVKLRV